MSQLDILKAELTADPLGRGYGTMTDADAAISLRTKNRDIWAALSSAQIFEAIESTEFQALSAAGKVRVDRLLGLGEGIMVAPGSKARAEIAATFGGGSQTVINLLAIALKQRSRADELGLRRIGPGLVTEARK